MNADDGDLPPLDAAVHRCSERAVDASVRVAHVFGSLTGTERAKIERVRICCVQGVRLPLSSGRESELSPWLNKRLFLNR